MILAPSKLDNLVPAGNNTQTSSQSASSNDQKEDENNIDSIQSPSLNKPYYQTGLDRYISITKRKLSPQKQIEQQNKHKKVIAAPQTNTNNRFSPLAEIENGENTNNNNVKPSRLPPIYVRGVDNKSLVNLLRINIGGSNFHIVPLKRDSLEETKIQVNDEDNYRKVISLLENKKVTYYTYQLKTSKGLIVVLKGIEPDVDIKEVKDALLLAGFETKNIHNIKNKNKDPQPLFKIELTPESSKCAKNQSHPIYNLRYLLNRRITVEAPRKNTNIPQCSNCQEYGHTRTYSALRPVCVICGGLHATANCPSKTGGNLVKKCNNCEGPHTANYRGCRVYKELKNKLLNRPKPVPKNSQYITKKFPHTVFQPFADSSATGALTYAQAVQAGNQPQNDAVTQNASFEAALLNITNAITQIMTTTMSQLVKSMQAMFQEFIQTQQQMFAKFK